MDDKSSHKHQHRGMDHPRRRPFHPNVWAIVGGIVLLLTIAFIVRQFFKDSKINTALPEVEATETNSAPINSEVTHRTTANGVPINSTAMNPSTTNSAPINLQQTDLPGVPDPANTTAPQNR